MPRCQHENATVEIDLSQKLTASQFDVSTVQTVQIRLSVVCAACRWTNVYRAYACSDGAGDPNNWPKWLQRLMTTLRDQAPVIEAACADLSVPRLSSQQVAP